MEFATWMPAVLAMLVTGLLGGIIAGMLGVGGGIVVVPVLESALAVAGMPADSRMHIAVATSLATIIPTSLSSTGAHDRRGAVDWSLAASWAPALLIGALAGSLVASHARGSTLSLVFGFVALAVAIKMTLPLDGLQLRSAAPRGCAGSIVAGTIGAVSAMMGIGGGTLAVPTLTLVGTPIHRAVGTASFFGLLIGVPGTMGYLLAAPAIDAPPLTIGLVSLIGAALIAPGSILTAPLGAKFAHALSRRTLALIFGLFLFVVSIRMLLRGFGLT
jgi:uncharacterized membrane protein YfcA